MNCYVIQTERLNEAQRAERALFDCLCRLPEGFFLYRELKVSPTYAEQVRGLREAKPDFVITAPAVGVLGLEVKDWNLDANEYRWANQYDVVVTNRQGEKRSIDNPAHQAARYQNALRELLRDTGVFVQCLVAFPRLTRQEFLNKFSDIAVLSNPQSRFFLDLDRTLFKDDLDQNPLQPDQVLVSLARKLPNFHGSTPQEIEAVNKRLMPTTFIVGDYSIRQQGFARLKVVSEEQIRWISGVDAARNYLLDVAGSGKTNALVSRAVHLVDHEQQGSPLRILLTTYSENLENNIRRIFEHKILESGERKSVYRDAITIICLPRLISEIVKSKDASLASREPNETNAAYEERLKEWAATIVEEAKQAYARYDYVLIDEIQDFDDTHLFILTELCRGKRYFFVGDVGQKIFERTHDLRRHGIITAEVELDKSYRMYRTPKYIAELAVEFVTSDPYVRHEFEQKGYRGRFVYPNELEALPVLEHSTTPHKAIAERVSSLISRDYTERDILVVTSAARLEEHRQALIRQGVRCSTKEPSGTEQAVMLTDFEASKGLERDVVLVSGVEDLYERSCPEGLADDEELRARKESLSRRKVYVALTRTIEQLYVYYSKAENRFVNDLLEINRQLLKKHQKRIRHG